MVNLRVEKSKNLYLNFKDIIMASLVLYKHMHALQEKIIESNIRRIK